MGRDQTSWVFWMPASVRQRPLRSPASDKRPLRRAPARIGPLRCAILVIGSGPRLLGWVDCRSCKLALLMARCMGSWLGKWAVGPAFISLGRGRKLAPFMAPFLRDGWATHPTGLLHGSLHDIPGRTRAAGNDGAHCPRRGHPSAAKCWCPALKGRRSCQTVFWPAVKPFGTVSIGSLCHMVVTCRKGGWFCFLYFLELLHRRAPILCLSTKPFTQI